MGGVHAAFSPSSAYRVVICPGSFGASRGKPNKTSLFAEEGTLGHIVHAECLQENIQAEDLIGLQHCVEIDGREHVFTVDAEMAEYVQTSVDWCRSLEGDHFVEERVNISRWTPIPNQFGTADHFVCQPGHLYVTDLKYGAGIEVYVEENEQALLYAGGVVDAYDHIYHFEKITIRISQPRRDHFDEWMITKAELLERLAWIKERFELAMQPDAPFHPDAKACFFCPIKLECAARAQAVGDFVRGAFDNLDADRAMPAHGDVVAQFPDFKADVGSFTPEQIAVLLEKRPLIYAFIKDLNVLAFDRMTRGDGVPGWKLAEGKTHRKWRDKEEAAASFVIRGVSEEFLYERELRSPAQIEKDKRIPKTIRKELVPALAHKPTGKLSMVPENDPRPAVRVSGDGLFEALEEEEFGAED